MRQPMGSTRRFFAVIWLPLIVGLAVSGEPGASPPTDAPARADAFDHAEHEGLFPTCTGCHAGVLVAGEDLYPPAVSCSDCHDGGELETVDWSGPSTSASNLVYDHKVHETAVAEIDETLPACTDCHGTPAPEDVIRSSYELCTACHTHDSGSHVDDTDCVTCHTPLARSALASRSDTFTEPADHDDPTFLASLHGDARYDQNRCATCHTADRCAACHVDASDPLIGNLGYASEGTPLPSFTASYPTPATHEEPGFGSHHADGLESATDCSTCHTQDDCVTCHVAENGGWGVMGTLPTRSASTAPGVAMERTLPAGHERIDFADRHRIEAASQASECATCHVEDQCVACHEGTRGPAYHLPGYEAGHAADAFGGFMDCASCHDTVVFCRTCHVEAGLMDDRIGAPYHDAEPLWLLRHGQGARQAMESCASCHEQRDCTRCHSAVGTFRVSPHRPGFDARAAWEKNFRICSACHLGDPFRS